ncbi:hypothetical protein [Rhizobium leguminosarum]|uniref:hypothetical protein n=1 Tax=Rhizobium leguminosarum TaxID=384 RepID=UPI003F9471EB
MEVSDKCHPMEHISEFCISCSLSAVEKHAIVRTLSDAAEVLAEHRPFEAFIELARMHVPRKL